MESEREEEREKIRRKRETWPRERQEDRLFFLPAGRGEAETAGWIPRPGPRQFNKLDGVWIFLISRRKLDGWPRVIVLPKRPPQKGPPPWAPFSLSLYSSSLRLPPLSLSLFLSIALILKVQTRAPSRSAIRVMPREVHSTPPTRAEFQSVSKRRSVSRLQSSSRLHRTI